MAVPWLAALKVIPWGQVINHAPEIAEGARKLWSTVGRKSGPVAAAAAGARAVPAAQGEPGGGTDARLAALEVWVDDLNAQMLASSELIKQLADQNAQLIKRVDTHRVRLKWLSVATALASIVAVAALLIR